MHEKVKSKVGLKKEGARPFRPWKEEEVLSISNFFLLLLLLANVASPHF